MKGMRPKKSLGQNFLVDRNVLDRIAGLVDRSAGARILEVGPGRGALTRILAEEGARVLAVELDRGLAPLLEQEFASSPQVEIQQGDILRCDLPRLLQERDPLPWQVAANLPYNISSQVLFKFLDDRVLFSRLVLMLQKEVGERLAAGPGTKDYGVLSVLFQLWFDIRKEFIVKPGSFFPVPKVDSVVLSFQPLPSPREAVGDEQLFKTLVKASFGQRRKTLWNCLKGMVEGRLLADALDVTGIDGGRRGETLTIAEFASLCRQLSRQRCEKGH